MGHLPVGPNTLPSVVPLDHCPRERREAVSLVGLPVEDALRRVKEMEAGMCCGTGGDLS